VVLKFAVLGAGAIGRIVARDLFESDASHRILIADISGNAARSFARSLGSRRVSAGIADAKDIASLTNAIDGSSVVINCTNHCFNLNVMQAALDAAVHYVDLGGLFVWTRRQLRWNRKFREAGLTAILGMGCAPGITNVMAASAVAGLPRVDSIRIRVGGVDFNAAPGFVFPYSPRTIVEELTLSGWKWSRGQFVKTKPRTGWELVDFGNPIGKVWTVMTRHSEIATLPLRYRKRGLQYADFKVGFDKRFVREILRRLQLGHTIEDFNALPAIRHEPNDYEITRVTVRSGKRSITMECHAGSNADWHANAGDIDTACPASIVAQMIARGIIGQRGVFAPEDVVLPEYLFAELKKRGVGIRRY
jgi:saccharopine dehydrogenase-like NADP-dependent oxidoreductase